MEWRVRAVVLAGLILLSPTVLATPTAGSFVFHGPSGLPSGAILEGTPLAVFTEDAPNLTRLVLTAPRANLREYTTRSTVVDSKPGPVAIEPLPEGKEEPLTDLRIELLGVGEEAWVGLYPPEKGHATLTAEGGVPVAASERSRIGNREERVFAPVYDAALKDGQPYERTYHRSITAPHITMQASGLLEYQGGGILKLYGLDVLISSNERDGVLHTGQRTSDGLVHEDAHTWALIEFDTASLTIENLGNLDLAFQDVATSWSGAATFPAAQGEIRTSSSTYAFDGRPAVISGEFVAFFEPAIRAGSLGTRVELSGNLESTTLQPQGAAMTLSGAAKGFPPLIGLAAVLVAVAGGAGLTVHVQRRRRKTQEAPPAVIAQRQVQVPLVTLIPTADDGLQADDCIRFADDAAVERRWARALHWAQRARALAPTNSRIRADEGEYLFQLGLFEESLQAFAEASRLDATEGYADYRGAQAAAAAGRPVDEVLSWLERALERSPDLVGDLELFKEFDGIRDVPGYDVMVRRAYDRLGIDPAPPF